MYRPMSRVMCLRWGGDLVVTNANAGLSPRGFHPLLSVCVWRIPAEEKWERISLLLGWLRGNVTGMKTTILSTVWKWLATGAASPRWRFQSGSRVRWGWLDPSEPPVQSGQGEKLVNTTINSGLVLPVKLWLRPSYLPPDGFFTQIDEICLLSCQAIGSYYLHWFIFGL